MCIENIRYYFNELGKPRDTQEINGLELQNIVHLVNGCGGAVVRCLDGVHRTTTFEEYMRFIINDTSNFGIYQEDRHDCDNFALALWGGLNKNPYWSGLALGYCEGHIPNAHAGHAYNVFVTNDGEVYFVEPQTDMIYHNNYGHYRLTTAWFS